MRYKVGDKVWAKSGYYVHKGKILGIFDDGRYVVKLFMSKSVFYEHNLAKRGGEE